VPIEIDTRILLLDAAERLFAEAGFAATSLRNITAVAGVNLASVNYHFGSKDALLEAVIQRRLAPVNDERLRRLDELEAQAGTEPLNLEQALRCFLEPPFEKMREWGESGRLFMRVVGRIHSDTNPKMAAMFLKQLEETLKRFTSALQRALPQLAPQEVSRRLHFVIGGMAHTLAWSEKIALLSGQNHTEALSSQLLEDLVQFAAAGMAAPVPTLDREEKQ
jgi:AcrR family transcriptional regulator